MHVPNRWTPRLGTYCRGGGLHCLEVNAARGNINMKERMFFLRWSRIQVLFVLSLVQSGLCFTYPPDKEALLAFKSQVEDYGYILSGWSEYTDPCIDKWRGVLCTCYPFFELSGTQERTLACTPLDPNTPQLASRIMQINLGDVRITDWNTLKGPLVPTLANLTELRVLNLAGNEFFGPFPAEWSALVNLEILSLNGNNISGRCMIEN